MKSLILRIFAAALALFLLEAAVAFQPSTSPNRAAVATIGVNELPKEARETLKLIKRGGPFPFTKDGSVFSNRERILPQQPRGYYREYTIRTPGVRHRGERRIVSGKSGEHYYTSDHYGSFKRIKE